MVNATSWTYSVARVHPSRSEARRHLATTLGSRRTCATRGQRPRKGDRSVRSSSLPPSSARGEVQEVPHPPHVRRDAAGAPGLPCCARGALQRPGAHEGSPSASCGSPSSRCGGQHVAATDFAARHSPRELVQAALRFRSRDPRRRRPDGARCHHTSTAVVAIAGGRAGGVGRRSALASALWTSPASSAAQCPSGARPRRGASLGGRGIASADGWGGTSNLG